MKSNKFNPDKFLYRILVFPFVFALLLIAHNLFVLKRMWHFLKFGGEYINYEENERPAMNDIYNELKKQRKEGI